MTKSKALVINMFGGPGAGKSTMAAHLFAELKWSGVNCELSTEFAKDKVWEESFKVLDSQIYIFGKQFHKLKRLEDKVEVIITDAPLLLSTIYNRENGESFNQVVVETFNSFNNINYFINRKKGYNPKGRMQTEDQSKEIDNSVHNALDKYEMDYSIIPGEREEITILRDQILAKLLEYDKSREDS